MVITIERKKSKGIAGLIAHIYPRIKMQYGMSTPIAHIQKQIFAKKSPLGPVIHPQGKNLLLAGQALYNLVIIIIQDYYYKQHLIQTAKSRMNVLNKPNYKSVKKILTILGLMAILCGVLVYLDMVNYFSLQNIVSVILGFLIMLFVQLRFISYYFQEQMKNYDLDQFGVVKDFIRSKIFGEINPKYIAKKSKMKYYQHTKDQHDKLFAPDSQQTYDSVIANLRARNQLDNTNRVKVLKDKWQLFLFKISQFQQFSTSLHKIYKDRIQFYKKFSQKVSSVKDEDYEKWETLFVKKANSYLGQKPQYAQYLKHVDGTEWGEMKKIIYDKYHSIQSITKTISNKFLLQFKIYANQMRAQFRQTQTQLLSSQNQRSNAIKTYRDVNTKIATAKNKINVLTQKIKKNKTKGSQNMQAIFNTQYQLRFLFIELENLQVRRTYSKDMSFKSSEAQYKLWSFKEEKLENAGLKKFNNRMSDYLGSYFDKLKVPLSKSKDKTRYFEELLKSQYLSNGNNKKIYENLHQLQKRLNQFKAYLNQLMNLSQHEMRSLQKINQLVKQYQRQSKKNISQYRYEIDTAVTQKLLDSTFLQLIQSTNVKEIELIRRIMNYIKEQYQKIIIKQQRKESFLKQLVNNRKQMKDVRHTQLHVNQSKGQKIMQNVFMGSSNLFDAYEFQLNNKLDSNLNFILIDLVETYGSISDYARSVRQECERGVVQSKLINQTYVKMNDYNDQLFKIEREEFQKEQEYGKKDQRELDIQSVKMVNKILNVFFSQWKNSQFFHELIKQQIQVSLNAKRPPILNYMSVKYLKIHQKQGDALKEISVLGDNLFICLFQVLITFKGKIALHIETSIKGKNTPVHIRLLVTEFVCPLRICYTPFCLGKSYMTMMKTPTITAEYNATVGGWEITKIPLLSTFIQIFIVIKLRKKFLYPKKTTMRVPAAVKNSIVQAIKQKAIYQKFMQKRMKAD